ncbi:hypothetical protein PV11_00243 [Exophiala sideris]|uniref:Sugar phosphate transporter domain-containing protein n=1 Tax=Exophiala sideris TaxID=1016849 RepID=A0A0D1YNP8_9EURO|nr:hypothetical protein PV11_00243 [Exophiala sideris]
MEKEKSMDVSTTEITHKHADPLHSSEKGASDLRTKTCIIINIIATVAIVYVNKAIFSNPNFRQCQLLFVAYHFGVTWLTLFLASRQPIGLFSPARTSLLTILPLTVAMGANVVLMNLSLAYSSVIFSQIVRILLAPLTALMNLVIYNARIPSLAVAALVPACLGVGLVSYIEGTTKASGTTSTSMLGVIFAFSGVAVSALYTVWVSAYHRTLKLTTAQLLLNQLPLGISMLVGTSFFTDKYPNWTEVNGQQWAMVALSGLCAMLINVSQFYIITNAGPVSSTVVGHLKTILIVGLGWIVKHEAVGHESALGIALAVLGIIGYSYALHLERNK